jgi:hypothetical protein
MSFFSQSVYAKRSSYADGREEAREEGRVEGRNGVERKNV